MDKDKVEFVFDESPIKKHTLGEISDTVAKMALRQVIATQQSVQRTAFLVGLAVGILAMNIIAVIVYSIFGCR